MMYLSISSDNTSHFYWYLNSHVLIGDGTVPAMHWFGHKKTECNSFQIYEVFSLPVPHSNLSAEYKVIYKYIYDNIWWDKGSCHHKSAVQNLSTCQWTVLQDKCTIPTPCKPTIMCYSHICQNDQAIKEQCSLVISHMPCHIPVYLLLLLQISGSSPQALDPRINNDNTLPRQGH